MILEYQRAYVDVDLWWCGAFSGGVLMSLSAIVSLTQLMLQHKDDMLSLLRVADSTWELSVSQHSSILQSVLLPLPTLGTQHLLRPSTRQPSKQHL